MAEFIHLRDNPDRSLIFGIELDRFEELAPSVRPARRVDDSSSADMIIRPVAVTLENALEVAKEPFGSLHRRPKLPICYFEHARGSEVHRRKSGIDDEADFVHLISPTSVYTTAHRMS
jgi:hypothetical protein